jgi:transposase-like protein
MHSVKRYSEAFKLCVVNELEQGRFRSFMEASDYYGISGACTVRNWVRKYGKDHLLGRVMRIEKPEEQNQVKVLKQRIRQLEKALAEAKVDEVFARAQFEVALKELGVQDLEAFKKKLDEKLSDMD